MTLEKLDPFYFKFKGKVARLLGRESVSNPIVALTELVKNSWDADATELSIIFENAESDKGKIRLNDNGTGLSLEEFESTWMTVATDDKEKTPFTKKYNRPKVGEKGIGRFGTEKLARLVEITSKPEKKEYGFNVTVNWDEYERGGHFDKIPNSASKFNKKRKEHGFEIILSNLREQWGAIEIDSFLKTLGLLLPPVKYHSPFNVKMFVGDSAKSVKKIKSNFLKLAVYRFKSTLKSDGTIEFRFSGRTGATKKSTTNLGSIKCGPAEFDLYFFYRDNRGNYPATIDIENIKGTLDRFKGLHLYRDNFKVNLAGDWAGLDKLRVNDPSFYPGYNQIIGFVKISKKSNPGIIDTTTRQGVIEEKPWWDLQKFIYESISLFVQNRKIVERKKAPVRKKRPLKKGKIPPKIGTEELLTFANDYPEIFYKFLEREINACYSASLLNGCLLLSRKMIENLIYNILREKFPGRIDLRWDKLKNRPHDFAILIDNLVDNKDRFNAEEQRYIDKFLKLCKPFKRVANSAAHNIMEYVENKKEIDTMKIPEMVQLMLNLVDKT